MRAAGTLLTSVLVDPARLGLPVGAHLIVALPPGRLDPVARALAGHPAVHGVLATSHDGRREPPRRGVAA